MKYLVSDLRKLTNFLLNNATLITLIVILNVLVWMLISGNYTSFLHPRFWPFLLAATVIIVLYIGAIIIGTRLHPNASTYRKMINYLVLLTPLFVSYTVAGQGMGVHAYLKKNTNAEQNALQFLNDLAFKEPGNRKTDTEGAYSILDLTSRMKQLNGQRVIAEGLTYTDTNTPKGQMILFRFAMFCCAADATPIGIVVNVGDIEPLGNEKWVRVKGVLETSNIGEKETPVIHAETIEKIETPPPGAQYMYF